MPPFSADLFTNVFPQSLLLFFAFVLDAGSLLAVCSFAMLRPIYLYIYIHEVAGRLITEPSPSARPSCRLGFSFSYHANAAINQETGERQLRMLSTK